MFDLPGFVEMRAEQAKIGAFETLARHLFRRGAFTLSPHDHRGEPDYGARAGCSISSAHGHDERKRSNPCDAHINTCNLRNLKHSVRLSRRRRALANNICKLRGESTN